MSVALFMNHTIIMSKREAKNIDILVPAGGLVQVWGQAAPCNLLILKRDPGTISGGARAWLDLALGEQYVTPQGLAGSPSSQPS